MTEPKINIQNIRDLGPQLTENPHQMVGQDGAYSIPLGEKTLWFFGDTLIGQRTPGESVWYPGGTAVGPWDMSGKAGIRRMINNCGLLLENYDMRNGFQDVRYILDNVGEIKTLMPLLADEHPDEIRIWCMHGIALQDKLYLFFNKVEMLADGPFPVNFDILGVGLVVGNSRDWEFQRVIHNGSDLFWRKNDPQFSAAILPDKNGDWLYFYGVKKDPQRVQQTHLARVQPENITNPDAYQYLVSSAPKWSDNIADARPIFAHPPNEQSISFNPYLNCYLAVHSFDITGKIVARTAAHPWGPWSEPTVITTIVPVREKPLPYPPLVYAAKEHPVLQRENGRVIYITYVEFEEYFPHLLEVTLA